MAKNPNFKTILLTKEQFIQLEQIQQKVRQQSPLGIAPGIHAIARQLMERALETYK
ncbi:TPA: hypothetical protein ACIPUI_000908 [Citrobacter freundii]